MSLHRTHRTGALTLVVLAACAAPPARLQPPPTPARADVAARVDSVLREFMARNQIASLSVAVSRGNETLVQRTLGVADVAAERPATNEMAYRTASVSKQFTAALLLKQVDRRRLSLGDSIGHFLTGLRPEWRKLTIEQLLNHTSGLHREFRQPSRMTEDLPSDTLILWAARDTMLSAPGTRHVYSNVGYMLLGALVEKSYGKSYAAALRDEISRPLGLRTLGWCTKPEAGVTEVTGYAYTPQGAMQKATYLHSSQSLGSGGICASAGDLAAWNRALHGGRVLSAGSYAAMTTPRGAAVADGYGFGVRIEATPWGTSSIFHDGGTPGFAAQSAWYPAEQLSVAVLYSGLKSPAVGGLLAKQLGAIALGKTLPAPTEAR